MENDKWKKIRVKDIRAFLKKHKKYFKINITGNDKKTLTAKIDEMIYGMPVEVRFDYKNLFKAVEEPKVKPKLKKVIKIKIPAREKRKPAKASPTLPNYINGKRINVKFGKPPSRERIETGNLNVGKIKSVKEVLNFGTFKNLETLIKLDRPKLKDSTIRVYMMNIKYILDNKAKNFDILMSPDRIKEKMKDLPNLRQRDIINAVVVAVKSMINDPDFLLPYENCRDNINLLYFSSNPKKYQKEIKFWIERKKNRKSKKDFCNPKKLYE